MGNWWVKRADCQRSWVMEWTTFVLPRSTGFGFIMCDDAFHKGWFQQFDSVKILPTSPKLKTCGTILSGFQPKRTDFPEFTRCGFLLFLKLKTSSAGFWVRGVSPALEHKLFCTTVPCREWDPCMVQKSSIRAKTSTGMGCGCCMGSAATTDVASEELWADFCCEIWQI